MMEQHKQTPWMIAAFESGMVAIDSSDDQEVTGFICPEDAIRILVCVNACSGFTNDELEGANLHKDSIDAQNEIDDLRADLATAEQDSRQKQARIDRIERERDELLAQLQEVLKRIEKSDEWWMDCPDRGGFDADAIRAAIARVKVGAE